MLAHNLTFIVGGARSGKSAYAEQLAILSTRPVTYIATARIGDIADAEFAARVAHHQARRPKDWQLIEASVDLAGALRSANREGQCILIDCLTLWLAGLLCPIDEALPAQSYMPHLNAFDAALNEISSPLIVVSNEIGLGVIPLGQTTRHYVDELGRLNQRIAARATNVVLMVAGLPLTIKPSSAANLQCATVI